MEKGLKNNLEKKFYEKSSPFTKRISVHALSRESQALSAQPLHLRLIHSAKLAKAKLSLIEFDLNSAKRQPNRQATPYPWLSATQCRQAQFLTARSEVHEAKRQSWQLS